MTIGIRKVVQHRPCGVASWAHHPSAGTNGACPSGASTTRLLRPMSQRGVSYEMERW